MKIFCFSDLLMFINKIFAKYESYEYKTWKKLWDKSCIPKLFNEVILVFWFCGFSASWTLHVCFSFSFGKCMYIFVSLFLLLTKDLVESISKNRNFFFRNLKISAILIVFRFIRSKLGLHVIFIFYIQTSLFFYCTGCLTVTKNHYGSEKKNFKSMVSLC